ncbi:hypothetical protein [Nisaea sp.]|uniref:hypothetical protein n=1 Tax=Nisaea sp. TaxID=2024842 RepID=UPI0032671A69
MGGDEKIKTPELFAECLGEEVMKSLFDNHGTENPGHRAFSKVNDFDAALCM